MGTTKHISASSDFLRITNPTKRVEQRRITGLCVDTSDAAYARITPADHHDGLWVARDPASTGGNPGLLMAATQVAADAIPAGAWVILKSDRPGQPDAIGLDRVTFIDAAGVTAHYNVFDHTTLTDYAPGTVLRPTLITFDATKAGGDENLVALGSTWGLAPAAAGVPGVATVVSSPDSNGFIEIRIGASPA